MFLGCFGLYWYGFAGPAYVIVGYELTKGGLKELDEIFPRDCECVYAGLAGLVLGCQHCCWTPPNTNGANAQGDDEQRAELLAALEAESDEEE